MTVIAITIDSKEPPWVKQMKFGDIQTAVISMPTGDFQLWLDDGHSIVIERKTSDDFLGSVRDGRIFNQVMRLTEMRNKSTWVYLLITGALMQSKNGYAISERGETGWSWASVNGAMLTIQEMGVPISYARSDSELEKSILALGGRSHGSVQVAPHREIELVSEKAAFLMSIPGIGEKRACEILSKADNNLAHALSWLVDTELTTVGKKLQENVRGFFGLQENETMEVLVK